LGQNVPNPFNPFTTIHYALPEASDVTLVVYDAAGRRVKTLLDVSSMPAGNHEVPWNGVDDRGNRVASGVYFYRLQAGAFVQTRRMVLIR
jgi:flagellar hook assembly protein FlgD